MQIVGRNQMTQSKEQLSGRLKNEVVASGATTVGIANLTRMLAEHSGRPLFAVAFTLRYPDDAVEQLPDDESLRKTIEQLGSSSKAIYNKIQMTISEADTGVMCCSYDEVEESFGRLKYRLSQKAVAQQAGLGWIGKSSLLVTPAFGPRARIGTMFTNAQLVSDSPYPRNECGRCRACIEVCPVNAVTEEMIRFEAFQGFRIARALCETYVCRNEKMHRKREFCGLCLKECPYGKRSQANQTAGGDA
jgi:epoxyqueuosine reductase QueG